MKIEVRQIEKHTADVVVSNKHYSRSPSIFWIGFGLYCNDELLGVVVYGQPSAALQKHAFNKRDFKFYELSRLVIDRKAPKNSASILIGRSLQMLDKPSAIVSYADSKHGHAGIVYQATNWIYTGSTVSHDCLYVVDGIETHPMTLRDRGITNPMQWAKENSIKTIKPEEKHRYFFFVGSKSQKKVMKEKLKYNAVNEYPKLEKSLYDCGPCISSLKIEHQGCLF